METLDDLDQKPEEVAARFSWAIRQGQPRWLWPDVSYAEWETAVVAIERATRAVLVKGKSAQPLEGPLKPMSVALYTSGMGPLIGRWMLEARISASEPLGALLQLHLHHNRLRMCRVLSRGIAAVEGLAAANIAATVLKGVHTAGSYFPEAAARPLSDVDLLIARSDQPRAAAVLGDLGYVCGSKQIFPDGTWREKGVSNTPRNLFYLHADEQCSVDLHLTLRKREGPLQLANLDALALWCWREWSASPAGRCLAQPALLLHLALHMAFPLSNVTLVRLAELVFVIRQDVAEGALSWEQLLASAATLGALGGIYPALRCCEELAPGTVPEHVLDACRNHVPKRALRFIDFKVRDAAGFTRCSLGEKVMWAPSTGAAARQIARDVLPLGKTSLADLSRISLTRAWRLVRRTLSA